MKKELQIKSIKGQELFFHEQENNTTTKTLEEAVKCNIDLQDAQLEYTGLSYAKLSTGRFNGANFFRIEGVGVEFNNADLSNARFFGAVLKEAFLSNAICLNVTIEGCILFNAVLSYADFTDAKITGSDFMNTDCIHAIFVNTDLTGTNFSNANLVGADFEGADLTNVNFSNANLFETNIEKAVKPSVTDAFISEMLYRNAITEEQKDLAARVLFITQRRESLKELAKKKNLLDWTKEILLRWEEFGKLLND